MTLDGKRHYYIKSKISLFESGYQFVSERRMPALPSQGPLVSLGEVLLAGKTLRCVGSCIPGQGPRIRLQGEARSPVDPPASACRFHGRCPDGQDRCGRDKPRLTSIGGRAVACLLTANRVSSTE